MLILTFKKLIAIMMSTSSTAPPPAAPAVIIQGHGELTETTVNCITCITYPPVSQTSPRQKCPRLVLGKNVFLSYFY